MIFKRFSKYIKEKHKKIDLNLGQVKLIDVLGQGGNGIVYNATIVEESVAIKFLITETTGSLLKSKRDRFIAEYFNVAKLENSNGIVKYFDYDLFSFEDSEGHVDLPVIIMKKYESSLAKLQENKSEEGFIKLFDFLLDTVEKIHHQGIIHRDLKPENILIENDNYFLADFGIASYNPEIFNIRADTSKKERLGNRLFSAPEQELANVEAHATMDIYAIGQILQWYVTNETHRGTNRIRISSIFKNLRIYDNIIDKCLSHVPQSRFQDIAEIKNYLERSQEKDIFEYMYDFNHILRSNFPKNDFGIIHSHALNRIDKLLQGLKDYEDKFDGNLWWCDGIRSNEVSLTKKGEAIWKLGSREYSIKEIWIHYDESIFNDFILIHYLPSEPFILNGNKQYYTTIVNNKHHITYSEYENGFAEIEDDIINLSEHNVELIERQKEGGYFFIGIKYHCILCLENENNVIDFIKKLKEIDGKIDIEKFRDFQWEIRKHKYAEVLMRL